ncbi:MAG: response regulator [Planctomycetota bacterium]
MTPALQTSPPLILVVDDDPDFRDVVGHVLVGAGYRVACAANPDEAFARMEREKPSLVLTDLVMTNLDAGFAFGRRIKDDPRLRDVPIVIATAISSQRGFDFTPRTPDDLRSMGADDYLAKPIAPRLLLEKIAALLQPPRETPT